MRSRVVLSLVFALACGFALAPAGRAADDLPDAKTLLERVRVAAGTPADNVRDVVRGHGTLADEVDTSYHLGKNEREIAAVGPIATETGTFEGTPWQRTANGLTVAVEPDPSPEPNASPTPAAIVERSSTPVADVIVQLDKSGYGTRTVVDPATAHIIREERISARGTVTNTYDAYAVFGAETLPLRWTVNDTRDQSTMAYERTEHSVGTVSPGDVAPPSSRALVTFPFGVAQVVLPTRFDNDKIVVHATVAGHPCDFFLDTGASGISVTPELAREAGLTTFNPERNNANAGSYVEREAVVPAIRVGQIEMHDVVVSIVPGFKNDSTSGLLGFDFLAQLGIRIDYERQTVTAVPGASFVPPADKNLIELDIRLGTFQPMTSATFDGAPANRMVIDTGGAGTILLFDHFARAHPEICRNGVPGLTLLGVGGPFDVDGWRIRHIRLGPVDFTNFTIYQVGSKGSYAGDEDGLIGYDLLRHFTVVLDYTNGRIFLTQNHGAAASDGLDP
jgi:predicted aspartyl protease